MLLFCMKQIAMISKARVLKSLEKYYIVDIGLRNLLLGERTRDIGHILENIVYLELLRRGYQVSIGKLDLLEVDFIAQKEDKRIYYQVSASVLDEKTYECEFAPLKKINDSYPKYVLTLDEFPMGEDGIEQKNIIDFLFGRKLSQVVILLPTSKSFSPAEETILKNQKFFV